ncbi:MAG: hypothetical protein JO316_00305 [Abitibacteriaceae bacterium]|nr:hypothetical protein [Abditibacteriaceae bacterium]
MKKCLLAILLCMGSYMPVSAKVSGHHASRRHTQRVHKSRITRHRRGKRILLAPHKDLMLAHPTPSPKPKSKDVKGPG